MTFKEQMQKDLDAIMTTNEFGEKINLDGRVVVAVLEPLELDFPGAADERAGVGFEGQTVHVRESDAALDFIPGKTVKLNGERWHVLGSERTGCLLTLKIYRERS